MIHLIHLLMKNESASTSGGRMVPVECERCHFVFFYQLWRTARGQSSGIRFVGEGAIENRAREAARKKLARRLARESEIVACPSCNWVNQELIDGYRRRYRAVPWITLLALFVTSSLLFLADAMVADSSRAYAFSNEHNVARVLAVGLCVAALPIGFAIQLWLKLRIHPNLTYPAPPLLPPGTPPALVAHSDTTGVTYQATRPEDQESGDEWVYFRWGNLVYPPACCRCMAPPATKYSPPRMIDSRPKVQLPLCAQCAKRIRSDWRRSAMHAVFAVVAICWLISIFIPGLDEFGRWTLFLIASFFGILIALIVLPSRVSQPYRLQRVDRSRGVFRIRTDCEEFNQQLASAVRARDSHVFEPAGSVTPVYPSREARLAMSSRKATR